MQIPKVFKHVRFLPLLAGPLIISCGDRGLPPCGRNSWSRTSIGQPGATFGVPSTGCRTNKDFVKEVTGWDDQKAGIFSQGIESGNFEINDTQVTVDGHTITRSELEEYLKANYPGYEIGKVWNELQFQQKQTPEEFRKDLNSRLENPARRILM